MLNYLKILLHLTIRW